MKITIEIECDNQAFAESEMNEVSRILKGVQRSMSDADIFTLKDLNGKKLRDHNGNIVGAIWVEG